jgi:hypothetical protein
MEAPPAAGSLAPADSGTGTEGAAGNVALEDIGLTALTARIIKTASISVEVKQDSFEDRFQQATMIAGRHGGPGPRRLSTGPGRWSSACPRISSKRLWAS